MKPSKQQKRTKQTQLLMKLALVLVSTALIVYFMPREDKFGYQYEVNQPWRYGRLVATFKFPIYKNDSVLHREQDSIMRRFQPYYTIDSAVKDSMVYRLNTETSKEWNGQNAVMYVKHIAALLDTVYRHGVLSVDAYSKLKEKGNKVIRVVNGTQASPVHVKTIFSTRSAYEYIMKSESDKYSRLVLQQYNVNELIAPNLTYDEAKSNMEIEDVLNSITNSNGFVQSGQKIVDRGELVTEDVYNVLESYEREMDKHKVASDRIPYKLIGQIVFVLVVLISLITYVSLFRADYYDNYRSGLLLFTLPVLFCVIASLMVSHKFLNVFMLPCCMVPIIIRVFMDSRTAFMFHCAMVLIISLVLVNSFDFLILQITAGMVAIQTLRELSERSQIIRTALLIFIVYVVTYTGYSFIHENSFNPDAWMYVCFAVNGVLLLFTYPLLWMLEKAFGFVSDVTLVELNSINNPLLQRMTEVAPGTFQHSMQVANLSAEVANKIGAKAQLVRTGALYHDIGKMERPVFFTENQNGVSPHKHLSAQKSAEVIIAHVSNGLMLADKNHIPDTIKRFITTHHGLGKAKYFYITYKNEHPDEAIDESLFTYPGPNPSSKEEAILMMCDSVEAASRSLAEYTEESINALVDKIIDGQMAEGYFSECSITFKDIATAKAVLKEKLKTIYHTRISYPELKEATNSPS